MDMASERPAIWRARVNRGAGVDRAVRSAAEDLLDRGAFATEVAHLVANQKVDWSARVGIYGTWGTGKTSVLNMIGEKLRGPDHLVVRFNPWGATTELEMWSLFARSVADSVKKQIPNIDVRTLKMHSHDVFAEGVLEKVGEADGWAKLGLAVGGSLVRRFLSTVPEALGELQKKIGERRMVVLVDDLDRLQPNLVPRALFALREVLDTPGLSFVLALDPVVVGQALTESHPGFGKGTLFLDKIVEFPRWLPAPGDRGTKRLLRRDHADNLPFVPLESLETQFELLPRNPRSLRKFLRNLWSLGPQVARFEATEIDWELLILLWLLRDCSMELWRKVVLEDNFEKNVAVETQTLALGLHDGSAESLTEKISESLDTLMEGVEFDPSSDRLRSRRILEAIASHQSSAPRMTLVDHARLTEAPQTLTNKEFFEAQRRGISDGREGLDESIKGIALQSGTTVSTVLSSFIALLIDHYDVLLGRSADQADEAKSEDTLLQAQKAFSLLRDCLVDSPHSTESPDEANKHAHRVVAVTLRWAHFTKSESMKKVRASEEALALRLCAAEWVDATEVLRMVHPMEVRLHYNAQAADLAEQLHDVVAGRVAKQLVQLFSVPRGIASLMYSRERYLDRSVLADPDGPLWSGPSARLEELRVVLAKAPADLAVRQNSLALLHGIAREAAGDATLASRREVMELLWRAATAAPLARRFFRRLRESRGAIEHALAGPLPTPPWWSRVEQTFLTSLHAQQISSADADHLIETTRRLFLRCGSLPGLSVRGAGAPRRFRAVALGGRLSEVVVGDLGSHRLATSFSLVSHHKLVGGRGELKVSQQQDGTALSLEIDVEFESEEAAAMLLPAAQQAMQDLLHALSSAAEQRMPVDV